MEKLGSESVQPIDGSRVDDEFLLLQKRHKQPLLTQIEQFSSYRNFIELFVNYIKQTPPGSSELKEKVIGFIYHQDLTNTPLGFFVDFKENLLKSGIKENSLYSPQIWDKVLQGLNGSLEEEFARTTYNLNQEHRSFFKLNELAAKAETSPETEALDKELEAIEDENIDLQKRAIGILKEDPSFAREFETQVKLSEGLKWLIAADPDVYNSQAIAETLGDNPIFIKANSGSWIDELKIRKESGQIEKVREIFANLLHKVKQPEFVWDTLARAGVIPETLVDSFDFLTTLAQLQKCSQALEGFSKEVRAKYLLPYLNRNISAGLLLEIAEGRHQFMDDLLDSQIDAFIHFYDQLISEPGEVKKDMSFKQKTALTVITAMVVAIPFIYSGFLSPSQESERNKVEQLLLEIAEEEKQENIEKKGQNEDQKPKLTPEQENAIREEMKKNYLKYVIPEHLSKNTLSVEELRNIFRNYPGASKLDSERAGQTFEYYLLKKNNFETVQVSYTDGLTRELNWDNPKYFDKNQQTQMINEERVKNKILLEQLSNMSVNQIEEFLKRNNPQLNKFDIEGIVTLTENYKNLQKLYGEHMNAELEDLADNLKKYPIPFDLLDERTKKALREGPKGDLNAALNSPSSPGLDVYSPEDTTGSSERTGKNTGSDENVSNKSDGFNKPENTDRESYERNKGKVVWRLQSLNGTPLDGYYRTSTASFFNLVNGWRVKKEIDRQGIVLSDNKDTLLFTSVKLGDHILELPAREQYAISRGTLSVKGTSARPGVYQTKDGTYVLEFAKEDVGKQLEINIIFGNINRSNIPPPHQMAFELSDMKQALVNKESLPQEFQQLFKQMDEKKLTKQERAKVLEKYIRNNFQYSLNSKWSDYYNDARTLKEFFRRIAEIKKCDCDVANTALIFLLRADGIPARIAYGFANQDRFGGPGSELARNEYHGWVEAFLEELPEGKRWVMLDGTPINPDEYTRKSLEGNVSLPELDRMFDREAFLAFLETIKGSFNLEQLGRGIFYEGELWRLLPILSAYLLYNLALYGGTTMLRRRNNEKFDKLSADLEERARIYLGDKYQTYEEVFLAEDRSYLEKMQNFGTSPMQILNPFLTLLVFPNEAMNNMILNGFMSKIPYANKGVDVQPSENPDKFEFLSKVLGFKEKEVRANMYIRSYRALYKQVDGQMRVDCDSFFPRDIYYFSGPISNFAYKLVQMVNRLKMPKTLEEWQKIKDTAIEDTYALYLKVRDKENKRRGFAAKPMYTSLEDEVGKAISFDDFSQRMGSILRFKLMLWQMEQEKRKVLDQMRRKI